VRRIEGKFMRNNFYQAAFSNFGRARLWLGIYLLLSGVTILAFPAILVALIAFPFIAGGIFLIQSWFKEHKGLAKALHRES